MPILAGSGQLHTDNPSSRPKYRETGIPGLYTESFRPYNAPPYELSPIQVGTSGEVVYHGHPLHTMSGNHGNRSGQDRKAHGKQTRPRGPENRHGLEEDKEAQNDKRRRSARAANSRGASNFASSRDSSRSSQTWSDEDGNAEVGVCTVLPRHLLALDICCACVTASQVHVQQLLCEALALVSKSQMATRTATGGIMDTPGRLLIASAPQLSTRQAPRPDDSGVPGRCIALI